MLRRLCHQIVPAIPGADLASVAVLDDNRPRTIAATSDQAKDIDQRQYDADSGPAVEAARTGKLVRVAVPDTAARWPQFADAALAAWVGSYLSAPLFLDEKFSGSLNLYGVDGHGFSELDAALLELYTTAAEAAIRQAERHRSGRETAAGLSAALTTRAVIDQAKGILMAARRSLRRARRTIAAHERQGARRRRAAQSAQDRRPESAEILRVEHWGGAGAARRGEHRHP